MVISMDKTFFKIVTVITIFWNMYGCGKPEICMTDIKSDFVISQNLAISLSKQSLVNKEIDVSNMEPVPYHSETPEKIFSRNVYDRNSGHVLWHKIGEKTLFEYSVSIRVKDGNVYCDAGKTL